MTATTGSAVSRLPGALGVRRIRLASGVVLFTYLLTHYTNHALGNVSLAAMEAGLRYHVGLWQSAIGTALLYSALTAHASLGLWALYERRQFRWKASEATQLVLGLSIPLLLTAHVVAERVALEYYGIERGYAQTLHSLWVASPTRGILQFVALFVAWTHGCIGLCFWLRMRPFWTRASPYLLAAAVLMPTLAALGYYQSGRAVRVPRGLSVLEASLRFNIPHASVCGGRGRCSTCRIRVVGDRERLPRPLPGETAVLERAGYKADSAVRLACQLRPPHDIGVVPLLPPQADASYVAGAGRVHAGEERYVVSMFVDMRGSTTMAEGRMPFDTVFIINRFVAAVSRAVLDTGGQPNQFLGDGMLALFGLDAGPAAACRQALAAAAQIAVNVAELNRQFAEDLSEPIRFGIGIHGGEVIVGDIGYRDNVVFTALGDAVNVTARLQDMTKGLACEVVFSDEVRKVAGLPAERFPSTEVAIRGRVAAMVVRMAETAATLGEDPARAG